MMSVLGIHANPVSRNEALQKARAFLEMRGMAASHSLDMVYQSVQTAHRKGAPSQSPFYYVFNRGNDAGFIIVSGDDSAEDVLGYAEKGSFDPDNIPDNMQAFLKGYEEQIDMARSKGLRLQGSADDVEVARKVVAPLLQTHWGQKAPYNNKCYDYNGDKSVAGCVATAMAQVMYYYKWPVEATAEVPGYTVLFWGYEYPDALEPITFQWDKMKPVYATTVSESDESQEAVADLMLYCGHSVRMDYGSGASGASPSYVPEALVNYFGYASAREIYRDSYSQSGWDELVYNQILNGNPLLYSAQAFTEEGSSDLGHAFVCDGYDGHSMYHINWGWNGMSDGYYRLQALRPYDQGTGGNSGDGGYSMDQSIIVLSVSEKTAPLRSYLYELYDGSPQTISYDSSKGFRGVTVRIRYGSSVDCSVDIASGIYQGGNLIATQTHLYDLEVDGGWRLSRTVNLTTIGKDLPDGHYQIKLLSRLSGEDEWSLNIDSDNYYVDVVISNGEATFTTVTKAPTFSDTGAEVSKVEQRFECSDSKSLVRFYLKNSGTGVYSDQLCLKVNGTVSATEAITVDPGCEEYVDFFFPAVTGDAQLVLYPRNDSDNVLYDDTFTFSDNPMPLLTVEKRNFKNVVSGKLYGRMLEGYFTLTNSSSIDYVGQIFLIIGKDLNNGTLTYNKTLTIPVDIKAGETKDVPFACTSFAIGDKFYYKLLDMSDHALIDWAWSDVFTVCPGVVTWTGKGERTAVAPTSTITISDDVAAVSLEELDVSKYTVVPNSNPNTLYYLAHGSNVPSSLSGKNVVMAYESGDIALAEGTDFFVPETFTASSISYTRTPVLGADGKNGWQTITLPFAVQKVTSAGSVVDWYHGGDTTEKDFWVREFKQVSGNEVQFANVQQWVANVPYIIAVPGDHWGAQYDMTNKPMVLSAGNARVERTPVSAAVSDSYEFVGTTGQTTVEQAYVLNEKGNTFVLTENPQVKAGNAYFTIDNLTVDAVSYLNIGMFDTDGICLPEVTLTDGQWVDVHSADGVKVAAVAVRDGRVDLSRLPQGVYIVAGKKVVR